MVVVRPVPIILAVPVVVLVVVCDQIVQGEAVVAGDEVDAVVGRTAVLAVKIGRSRQPPAQVGQLAAVAFDEAPHGVAKFSIPFRPIDGKIADLVGAEVPGLRHHDHAIQHRVLRDGVEKRRRRLEMSVLFAPEHRGQVEAKAVHMHRLDPVTQRVHDQPDHCRTVEVETVAAAGVVHIVAPRRVGRPGQAVVREIVETAKGNAGAQLIALGGVIVDHIEDDFDPGLVKLAHQRFELGNLAARCPIGAVR